jgi:hypothetical protein
LAALPAGRVHSGVHSAPLFESRAQVGTVHGAVAGLSPMPALIFAVPAALEQAPQAGAA